MPLNPSLVQLLRKHGLSFLRTALDQLEDKPAARLQEGPAREQLAADAWKAAPLQMRLVGSDAMGWNEFMAGVCERAYGTIGGYATVRRDWERVVQDWLAAGEVSASSAGSQGAAPSTLRPFDPSTSSGQARLRTGKAEDRQDSGQAPSTTTPASVPAESSRPVIGIDLGTTYSVVAYLDHQGRPTSIPNAAGEILTPSVVLFDPEGPIVGKQAVLAAAMDPDRVAECVKRDMGAKMYRKPIAGEYLPPEVISSFILKSLRNDARRKLGPVTDAVITVPAYFDEPRRRATMDAGRMAGLNVLDIVNEPTAAAIAFGYQEGMLDREVRVKGEKPLRVLVYDLGGGTFDVTIVELAGQQFKALATDGDVQLGGKDWDEKLVEIAAERFKQKHGSDPRDDPSSLQELWQAAELAKKTLSELSKANMLVNHRGTRAKVEVTRQEFDEATAPLVDRTRTTTEIVVMQAGLSWADIDKVLLVGGSSRMLAIPKMLKELCGKEADRSVSADEAVAHGAALYADLLSKRQRTQGEAPQFTITNVNSHSLGVAGVEPETGRRVNAIVIPKNTALPRAANRKFKTAKANQPSIKITVLEGESEQPDACTQVGVCVIRDLPPNLPAGWPVEVRFNYGENGRLEVSGKLSGHQAAVTIEFARDNSLTDDDLLLWGECVRADST